MRQQEYNEIQDIKRDLALVVIVLIALMGLFVVSADAKINNCQEVAQSYAGSLHTQLVWIQYQDSNGAYIFDGKNGAHIINSKVIKGKRYFFDFSLQAYDSRIFNSKEEVSKFYEEITGHKNEVYIIGVDSIPFRYNID